MKDLNLTQLENTSAISAYVKHAEENKLQNARKASDEVHHETWGIKDPEINFDPSIINRNEEILKSTEIRLEFIRTTSYQEKQDSDIELSVYFQDRLEEEYQQPLKQKKKLL